MRILSRCIFSFRCVAAVLAGIVLAASAFAVQSPAEAEEAVEWPAAVEGWVAPQSGEHPRLFFRKTDLPEIRRRAATPEGKAIVARLRALLGGGEEMPSEFNPQRGPQGDFTPKEAVGKTFTLWHAAGFGMLFQVTGEKKYAELGRACVEKMLAGQRDRDNRYSFRAPNGALRAGPSLGAMAMAYDLNYDGWDSDFRQEVARAMQDYNEGAFMDLAGLVRGSRHGPHSNHWGCQVGGGALAVLAINGDAGTEATKIEPLVEQSREAILRQLNEGFGDGGMFWEGKGPGGIGSDTALVPALQAWRVAGGQDFSTPEPNAAAITLIKVHELLTLHGEPWYPIPAPSGYGSGYFGARAKDGVPSDRDGLSRAGQFAQGFGAIPEEVQPAALWVYNQIVEPDPQSRTYDTVSPYPHRAVLALVNWPIGIDELNPAEIMPRVHYDLRLRHYAFRNQWTGTEEDIVVNATFGARDPHPLMIWGHGEKINLGSCPRGEVTHFAAAADGSGTVTGYGMALGVDFSKSSGAAALVVVAGNGASGQRRVVAGKNVFHLTTLGGQGAEATVEGDRLVVGSQSIDYDGKRIVFGQFGPPSELPRLGLGGSPLVAPRPKTPLAGEPLRIENVRYRRPSTTAAEQVQGALFHRARGETAWKSVPLAGKDEALSATIPGEATRGPLEYYVEVRDAARDKTFAFPTRGAAAPAAIVPDATPPRLSAAPRAPEIKSYRVALAWEPGEDDLGVAGYEVYRSLTEGGLWDAAALVGRESGAATNFRDDDPPQGKNVYYGVVPVDVAMRRGAGESIAVAVPADGPPINELKLTATAGPKANVVQWQGAIEPDVSQVLVFRIAGQAKPMQVAAVDDPTAVFRWVDRELEANQVYRYAIRLRDKNEHVSEARETGPVAPKRYWRRINCGGKEVLGPDGVAWERDDGAVSGTGRLVSPSLTIAGTADELQEVYRSERWSYKGLRYAFRDLEPGKYVVVLHLAEANPLYSAAGKRTFDVVVNGSIAHEAVDVFSRAGGAQQSLQLSTDVEVQADRPEIVLELLADAAGPSLRGIEVWSD